MAELDIKTLVLILLTLNSFGFLAYIYTRFSILRMPGISLWAAGHLALAISFFCLWRNFESPQKPLLLLIVTSILAAQVFWWASARLFFKRKRIHPFLMLLPALFVILFTASARTAVALQWMADGALFQMGYILVFLTCAFYQLVIAREFFTYDSPRLMTSVALGCAFTMIATLSLLKAITAPASLPPMIIIPNTYSIASFAIVLFIQVFSMFGLVLISAERLQFSLNKLAQSDPLTGLLNRRGFEALSKQEIKHRRRDKKYCAIMEFDLDLFKSVNDTYGHSTGDDVLKVFADCLTTNTRSADIVARFGGEEFVVLCVDVDDAEAKITAKRICESMAEHTMHTNTGEDFFITVSVGLAMIEKECTDLSVYMERADSALYNAKAMGRNQVVMAAQH